jgi:hypothetical protein
MVTREKPAGQSSSGGAKLDAPLESAAPFVRYCSAASQLSTAVSRAMRWSDQP